MQENLIECPECGHKFALTQALSHELEERIKSDYDKRFKDQEAGFKKVLESKENELEEKFEKKYEVEKEKIEKKLTEKVKKDLEEEMKEQKDEALKWKNKYSKQKEKEAELIMREGELADKEQDMKIKFAKDLNKERENIKKETIEKLSQEHQLTLGDKDKDIAKLKDQINELQRSAEQGSMKQQGTVQEMILEEMLANEFPNDEIESIKPGTKGADIIQKVKNQSGKICGIILWESKRTKNWANTWIEKLKQDQRRLKADVAVIVSSVLPEDIKELGHKDNIWISDLSRSIALATALRITLMQIYQVKASNEGKVDKKALVYNYIVGSEFKTRVETMVETFINMQSDINTERSAMERSWSKREKQVQASMLNIAGFIGDLQGIGASLPTIKKLELPESK